MSAVPWANEDELLYLCSFQCILCGLPLIQNHHIDGNPANNDPDNWAILCQMHHDLANRDLQVQETHTRKFTPELLKDQRKRHIENCLFSRFGYSGIPAPMETDVELGLPVGNDPNRVLLKRTIRWLNER
jgi:hypothetical protein